MTGLNLESFLQLLRADLGAWTTVGLIACLFALMTWTSWGSRRALRKCLVLSVAAHVGLVIYGSTHPLSLFANSTKTPPEAPRERIRKIRVSPLAENPAAPGNALARGRRIARIDPWDRSADSLAFFQNKIEAPRAAEPRIEPSPPVPPPLAPLDATAPELVSPLAAPAEPPRIPDVKEPPPAQAALGEPDAIVPAVVRNPALAESDGSPLDAPGGRPRPPRPASAAASVGPRGRTDLRALASPAPLPAIEAPTLAFAPLTGRTAPREPGADILPETSRARPPVVVDPDASAVAPRVAATPGGASPDDSAAESDLRRRARPTRTAPDPARRTTEGPGPLALARTAPSDLAPRLPEVTGSGGRHPGNIPDVYRSRLDPNRSAVAERAGASPASEQAVERALDWLARHQDADGRWDGGVARYSDGAAVKGDDDFTVHCPPGEPCFGECIYWEADTALTGLALLSFLGSGYTHTDGKYAETVDRGVDFLLKAQTKDGDLRGTSKAVGMYCHAMATLALCESYAMTGDERLRDPVERAIAFLIRARARDGMAWRYAPGSGQGDTSILGWVVMALKSAKLVGIPIPTSVQSGTLRWLERVSSGSAHGLASYQPGQPPTPTMTAEAWVCRQFLGVGGPGPASTEAARELLQHGPDRDPYNLYYWYYGTLSMYQHGGEAWTRWNSRVRDQVVKHQRIDGHQAGSWDPDDSEYGSKGGRIYCTALATLTLEVYYRYLRLYDSPRLAPSTPHDGAPPAARKPAARNRS